MESEQRNCSMSKIMKILFFARRFYPDIGGVEKHVLNVSEQLLKLGHTVTVIAEDTEGQSDMPDYRPSLDWHKWYMSDKMTGNAEELANPGQIKYLDKDSLDSQQRGIIEQSSDTIAKKIIVYRIPKVKEGRIKKVYIWLWLWKNKSLIKEADVVHCHDVFFWYMPFRFLYPRKPVYTTFHGYESYPIKKKSIIIRKISELLSRGNICIGDFIQKWYYTRPTFVSYGAVTVTKDAPAKETNKPSAVFIGRLDEQTSILTYAKAFACIKKRFPAFQMTVIGDGVYRNKLNKEIKSIGFKRNADAYLEKYRFAFISRYLGILEAFAAKRLVFAIYDNPVKEDYLKLAPYSKWIVIVNSENDLCNKVAHYLNNPKEEKILVNKAYQWVEKQTWENMTNLYLRLWNKER